LGIYLILQVLHGEGKTRVIAFKEIKVRPVKKIKHYLFEGSFCCLMELIC